MATAVITQYGRIKKNKETFQQCPVDFFLKIPCSDKREEDKFLMSLGYWMDEMELRLKSEVCFRELDGLVVLDMKCSLHIQL